MIKSFKTIATLEGLSLLALLLFAMPMKYIFNNPIYVKNIGMAHGVLFIIYILFSFLVKFHLKWNLKTFLIVCLASIIPFGTFYIEKKYLRDENI
jgi:integral membrane protein